MLSRRTSAVGSSSSLAMIERSVSASGGRLDVVHDVDVDPEFFAMRTALVEEFQCVLWKIVAAAVVAMRSRLRRDRKRCSHRFPDRRITSHVPTPSFAVPPTEGDAMSHRHPFHPVPRGGIDPIRSADDALAVLALGAPYDQDTILILLDARRRGTSIVVVGDTHDPDALFRILDTFLDATRDDPEIAGVILATSRPDGRRRVRGHPSVARGQRSVCGEGGLELVEWFVLGRTGPRCPRDLFGEPDRWDA
jgi:hypothetical protein